MKINKPNQTVVKSVNAATGKVEKTPVAPVAPVVEVEVTEVEETEKGKAQYVTEKKLDTAMPADFSFETHRPIARKFFSFNYLFLQHKAEFLKAQAIKFSSKAAELTQQAEDEKNFDPEVRNKMKKVERIAKGLESLSKELGAEGVDVAALLKQFNDSIKKTVAKK